MDQSNRADCRNEYAGLRLDQKSKGAKAAKAAKAAKTAKAAKRGSGRYLAALVALLWLISF